MGNPERRTGGFYLCSSLILAKRRRSVSFCDMLGFERGRCCGGRSDKRLMTRICFSI